MFFMTSLTKWQGDKMMGQHLNIQFVLKVKKTLTFGNDVLNFFMDATNVYRETGKLFPQYTKITSFRRQASWAKMTSPGSANNTNMPPDQ
jgi:hypothetical protein